MPNFSEYKEINSKTKKRFLIKKPNLNESSEQFERLSRELQDQKAYSGYCSLAVARCENDLGNRNKELQALLDSGRKFSDSKEVVAALDSYARALQVADEAIRKPITLELAQLYVRLNRLIEAGETYRKAQHWEQAANCYIEAELFDQAYDCYVTCSDRDKLRVQDLISVRLLHLILFNRTVVRRSSKETIGSDNSSTNSSSSDMCANGTDLIFQKLAETKNDSSQELSLLLQTLEILLDCEHREYVATAQLQDQLDKYLNKQNQCLIRQLLDPIKPYQRQ